MTGHFETGTALNLAISARELQTAQLLATKPAFLREADPVRAVRRVLVHAAEDRRWLEILDGLHEVRVAGQAVNPLALLQPLSFAAEFAHGPHQSAVLARLLDAKCAAGSADGAAAVEIARRFQRAPAVCDLLRAEVVAR